VKFMLLMHVPATVGGPAPMSDWKPAEIHAHIDFMLRLNKRLAANGELVLAEGLDFPPRPQIVVNKGTKPVVSDGPFPETKEFLVGFWIVDVPSRERALAIAGEASAAPGPGGRPMGIPIEVRQVMSGPPETP
jgi:hypothetical protein